MHALLSQKKPVFESVIDHLHKELAGLRTGRATPALVEDISVSAYDAMMEIKGLASIQVQDAKTLIIDPWDKNLLRNIEKGIRDAGVGLSPVVDGTVIRIVMPSMTEENRKTMVKKMKEYLEDTRIALRQVREEARDAAGKMEKEKQISEDEKFKLLDEIDKMTKEFNDQIDVIGEKKEEEIMTV
ncbi:MAG: ribosome recycling factor [Candidatus Uhrbacteria bacterium]|nr:ribosome recycling factor [Candidatus Uhrbacteria bacterium]